MGNFFSLDSPFARIGNMVADVFILSFFWLVFSIPIFTAGAATTALYYVMTKRISNKEGYLFRDFFTSFKREFVKATIVWVSILVVFGVLFFNISQKDMIFTLMNFNNTVQFIYVALQICLLFELAFFSVFVFPLLARFDVPLKTLVTNAFFMANKHFPTTLLCIASGVAVFYVIVSYAPVLIIGFVGMYTFVSSLFIIRVFKKYRPEMDADFLPQED